MTQIIPIVSMMTLMGVFIIMIFSTCEGMSVPQTKSADISESENRTTEGEGVDSPRDSTTNDSTRGDKQYPDTPYIPYPVAISPYGPFRGSYSAAVADGYFNPFPNYYPARLGGITGPGNRASSCAYAYPNRRYSCLGLGRRK